jgi:hypothetical protein
MRADPPAGSGRAPTKEHEPDAFIVDAHASNAMATPGKGDQRPMCSFASAFLEEASLVHLMRIGGVCLMFAALAIGHPALAEDRSIPRSGNPEHVLGELTAAFNKVQSAHG